MDPPGKPRDDGTPRGAPALFGMTPLCQRPLQGLAAYYNKNEISL